MNNDTAYKDKIQAKREQREADVMKLKAKLKEANGDVRLSIQQKIYELQAKINS